MELREGSKETNEGSLRGRQKITRKNKYVGCMGAHKDG